MTLPSRIVNTPVGRDIGGDAAVLAPLALVADQRHDLVTGVEDVLQLEVQVAPGRQPVAPVGSNAVVAW